jgi:hypothetical protein
MVTAFILLAECCSFLREVESYTKQGAAKISSAGLPVDLIAGTDNSSYLEPVVDLCKIDWPNNRNFKIIFDGNGVPSGYFKTREVNCLESYQNLLRISLAKIFPHTVINVIVTSIGVKPLIWVRPVLRLMC